MGRHGGGEGSIYRRRDGRWEARITLGYEGGKRRRKAFYSRTRQAVAAKLRKALADQADGLPVVDERVTVGAFLRTWLDQAAKPAVRPSTFDSYRRICELHLIPALGHVRLPRLQPQSIQGYLNAKREAGLSARTCQYHHAVLRRALGQAERWGMVPRNVAKLVSPPRVQREEISPPTVEEAKRFLAVVEDDRLRALYVLAMATGARQGELLALTWNDVDVAAATVTIRATLQRTDGEFALLEPKTASSRRTLALPAPAVEALRAHRVGQLEGRLAAGPAWQGERWNLVFADEVGAPLSRYTVSRSFHAALKRAGLPTMRFHDLRHAAATFMLSQGVPLKVIQRVLGHSQIAVTANTYSHVMPELQRDAAERVGDLLWSVS